MHDRNIPIDKQVEIDARTTCDFGTVTSCHCFPSAGKDFRDPQSQYVESTLSTPAFSCHIGAALRPKYCTKILDYDFPESVQWTPLTWCSRTVIPTSRKFPWRITSSFRSGFQNDLSESAFDNERLNGRDSPVDGKMRCASQGHRYCTITL